jgi:hypothetical protein
MKIYNHDISMCTHAQVVGNYLYSGRVLGLTEPEDIIQLHSALEAEWPFITAHYQQIALSYSLNPIWTVDLEQLTQYPGRDISVFYFGDTTSASSSQAAIFRSIDPQWAAVVAQINSKNYFIQLAHELGIPVPQTFCLEDKVAFDQSAQSWPFPCYLKPAVSVDGVGIARCADQQQLVQALSQLDHRHPFQIQEELVAVAFLNLQYSAKDQGCDRIAVSEQILSECAHQGNRYPSCHQPWEIVEPMAEWLVTHGMKDIFAFDVAVCDRNDQLHYLALECNPRFNGASYPTGIARKLNIDCWAAETFYTQHRSLQQIDLSDLAFNPASGVGIILVNWGTVLVGKLVVLLAGSIDQQNELRSVLKTRL